MKKDFYTSKLIEIHTLMKANKNQEAYDILQAEMNMPYVPATYEQKFQNLKTKLASRLNDYEYEKQIPLAKALEMLWGDQQKQMVALNTLPNYHLEPAKRELKKRIETWNDKFKQGFLYELLAKQKIDIDIRIKKSICNPQMFSIFKNSEVAEALLQIQKLAFKAPQTENLAISELHKYLLINFPTTKFNGKKVGKIIFNIVSGLLNNDGKLTNEEQKIKEMLALKK